MNMPLAHKWLPEMVKWRRYLHLHPELSYEEKNTSLFVAGILEELGLEVRRSAAGYGVTGVLRGSLPGPVVVLRADMDALPIQDEKSASYSSQTPGVMHACGHDGHTAMLLAAASHYAANRTALTGELRFLFQPAEEVCPGGALNMIAEGVLKGADAIYGVHLWTPMAVGSVGSAGGPLMASADEFFVDIHGQGGHAGTPHAAVDSIVAASALVMQLQTIVSRSIDPLRPAVISVGTIQGGNAQNVVAERCRITGTVRAFDEETRLLARRRIGEMAASVSSVYGATAEVDYLMGYPPLVNDESEFLRFLREAPQALGPEAAVLQMEKLMPAEDFAYYLHKIPGCFMFVGAGNADKGFVYPHHHAKFDFDEEAMVYGLSLLIAMADSRLAEAASNK